MGSFGGFYKGEKKKKGKGKNDKQISSSFSGGLGAPTFEMPKIIEKKKPYQS